MQLLHSYIYTVFKDMDLPQAWQGCIFLRHILHMLCKMHEVHAQEFLFSRPMKYVMERTIMSDLWHCLHADHFQFVCDGRSQYLISYISTLFQDLDLPQAWQGCMFESLSELEK